MLIKFIEKNLSFLKIFKSPVVQTNNTNTTVRTQTTTTKKDTSVFKWVKDMLKQPETVTTTETAAGTFSWIIFELYFFKFHVLAVPIVPQGDYSELFKKRRPCPQCSREDHVYRADLLFHNENDMVGISNELHFVFFPHLTTLIHQAGLLNNRSFSYLYGNLFISPIFFRTFLSRRYFYSLYLTCILAGVCMLSRFITGVFALQNDFENDGCSSVLTNHVDAKTRFCFFMFVRMNINCFHTNKWAPRVFF